MARIWTFVKKNFDIVLVMGTALVVCVLDLLNVVKLEIIAAAILMVLSLTAFSLLKNRAAGSHLQQTAETILDHLQKPSADRILLPHGKWVDEIDQRLGLAKEVWILSRTCIRLWWDYQDQFMKLLSDGQHVVRLMLIDPDDGAVKMMVENSRGFGHFDAFSQLQADIKAFLAQQAWLCSQPNGKSLQVRTIDYLPAWTLIMIDPRSDTGIIYVELGTYCANSRKRPTFSLLASRDTQLYRLFREEYETMWSHAQALDPVAYGNGTTSG